MPFSFILIAVFLAALLAAGARLEQSGQERKEQGKPNYLRPIILVVGGAILLIILWGMVR